MPVFTVAVMGKSIAVRSDTATIDRVLHTSLRAMWAESLVDREPEATVYATLDTQSPLPPGTTYFVRAGDPRSLANQLADVIVSTALALQAPPIDNGAMPTVLGVRACAVADSQGRAIVFLGSSRALGGGRRESILRQLAGRFAYVSDTAVAVEVETGRVWGATKPFSTYDTERLKSRRDVAPREAGLAPHEEALRFGALIVLERGAASGSATWERLSIPEATALLAPAVPCVAALGAPVQGLAALVDRADLTGRVRFSRDTEVASLVEALLADAPVAPLSIPIDPCADEEAVARPGDIRRMAVTDGVSDGEYMAICRADGAVLAIGGIAPQVWDLTRSWISLDDLTERVIERLGPAPIGHTRELVSEVVDALVAEQIMARL